MHFAVGNMDKRRDVAHRAALLQRSRRSRNRDKCASRASRWHRPNCCVRRAREYRDDRVWTLARANRLRCRAGSHETSVAQTPCTSTDPDVKNFWLDSSTDIAQRIAGTCAAAENPQAARKPVCRSAWDNSGVEKPQLPKITSESVTPLKSAFVFSINSLRYALGEIAGQQCSKSAIRGDQHRVSHDLH